MLMITNNIPKLTDITDNITKQMLQQVLLHMDLDIGEGWFFGFSMNIYPTLPQIRFELNQKNVDTFFVKSFLTTLQSVKTQT